VILLNIMLYLPIALLAYFFNSISITISRLLLVKDFHNPFIYIFYISAFSFVALLAFPFTHLPTMDVFLLSSLSTLLWTSGAYFLFKALKIGQTDRVVPVIGTLIPLILLFQGAVTNTLSLNELWAIIVLILGLVFITLELWKGKFNHNELLYELLSAVFFAFSYTFLKEAFNREEFWTVTVYSRFILIPFLLTVFIVPKLRKIIMTHQGPKINFFSKVGLLFIISQITGGLQGFLLNYAIKLESPAVVNSLQGTQYIFLFFFNLMLLKKYPKIFKENLKPFALTGKIAGIVFISMGLFILSFSTPITKQVPVGVTYSPRYAADLYLDPKTTYIKMLDELKVKHLRFPVYWDEVERNPGSFNFTEEDFYLREADKRGVKVILVVGMKQPRWPECFVPDWAEKLHKPERDGQVLKLVEAEVNHFKKYKNIVAWQVENEPFLSFGICPQPDERTQTRLKKEIEIVRSLDNRPVLITDSGELTTWRKSLPLSDWFGTTLYRTVWSPVFGTVDYPIPPIFYQTKAAIVKFFTLAKTEKNIVIELQAEPWATAASHITDIPISEQMKLLTPSKILYNIEYAKQTHFDEIYLWGVEWWYYMLENGRPEYLETVKSVL
jgi:uncharacterized membrane protein